MAKRGKVQMNGLERAINSREKGIARMRMNIDAIREKASKEIADIEKRIDEKKILLDALKRGAIKA